MNNADCGAHKNKSKEDLAEPEAHKSINKLGLVPVSL